VLVLESPLEEAQAKLLQKDLSKSKKKIELKVK